MLDLLDLMRPSDYVPRVQQLDAIVVGGGPAGSTAAHRLTAAGLRVVVLDREDFPRVKLCAGWLSEPIWDALELLPSSYPRGLWTWERCHVHFQGRSTAVATRGYFIRRYELDEFLLRRSGAEVVRHAVGAIQRDGDHWIVDGRFRARYLLGAAGTHCPVARLLAPRRTEAPVGVQEIEYEAGASAVAAHRLGRDGEPELLLHDDVGGYSWNVPKTGWLNVGTGTMNAKQVRQAWAHARAHFKGHLPPDAGAHLEKAKGHAYYLFDPAHLERCEGDGAFLVGDALGLAQPITAEGILPAVISGRLAADAILAGDPASYRQRLRSHPVLQDYDLYYRLRMAGSRLKERASGRRSPIGPPAFVTTLLNAAVARGFGWMFAGRPVAGRRAWQRFLGARS